MVETEESEGVKKDGWETSAEREGERLNGKEKVTTFLGAVGRKHLELVLLLLSEISVHRQWLAFLTAVILKC